jgi:hypothetical protein
LLDSERPKSRELYFLTKGETLGNYLDILGGVLFSLFWIGVDRMYCTLELADVGV